MNIEFLGKLDGNALFKFDEGRYVVVDSEEKRYKAMWTWYGQLGRCFDLFEKCDGSADELACLEIIKENMSDIVNTLNGYEDNVNDDVGQQYLKEQEEFYNMIEPNRVYDWYLGKYEDEAQAEKEEKRRAEEQQNVGNKQN